MTWQRASGWRAGAEAAIARCERVIGDRLSAHGDEGRRTEVMVSSNLLNRTLGSARPTYVRVA